MRKTITILCLLLCAAFSTAQDGGGAPGKGNFDPKDFEQRLEKFVVKEAGITKTEAAKFLPIYREMRQKQIAIMDADRQARKKKPATDKECEAVIKAHDAAEVQLKRVLQTYHAKMLAVIPASKVMKVTLAENKFHREAFRKAPGKGQPPRPKK
ncbi:MAG: hypothetical protein LUC22_06815 [Prevotella sp.]|nr:hypothetical protein [Prevotella sp.]